MIGEIPISDACHYMDAHDTETRIHMIRHNRFLRIPPASDPASSIASYRTSIPILLDTVSLIPVNHSLLQDIRVVEMVRFASFLSSRAVVKKDLDESIEVEVEVTPGCEPSSFLTVSCDETSGSMTKSYDSDDRATDNKLTELDVSGKKSSAFEGKEFNLLSPPTEETTMDSWPSASSSEYQDDGEAENPSYDEDEFHASGRSEHEIGIMVTNYLEREIANATEDEGPDFEGNTNNVVEADASSEAQEDNTNATEEGPEVEGIADERVAVANVNGEFKDETENGSACRPVASSAKLTEMMRKRIQAVNSILAVVEREREKGKSSHYVYQCYLLSAYSVSPFVAIISQRMMSSLI